jgi:hypothetical protein
VKREHKRKRQGLKLSSLIVTMFEQHRLAMAVVVQNPNGFSAAGTAESGNSDGAWHGG